MANQIDQYLRSHIGDLTISLLVSQARIKELETELEEIKSRKEDKKETK